MKEFNIILAKCGDFNRHQAILITFFCIINLLSSMHYYSQTIITLVPEHWCDDDILNNLTFAEIQKYYKETEHFSCTDKTIKGIEPCRKWIYFYEYGFRSIISDFNWICLSAWKSNLGQSMFFIGAFIGIPAFAILAETIGRLPVLIISNLIAMIGNLLTIFSKSVLTFSIYRLMAGLAINTNVLMITLLVVEYIKPEKRTLILTICNGVFYCFGAAITPWIAILVGNWKIYLLSISLAMIVIPFSYFCIPESALWLIANKKYDKSVKCLRFIAKVNGKQIDESVFQEFFTKCLEISEGTPAAPANKFNFLALLRTPNLRKTMVIVIVKSMIITLSYDAISRNIQGFAISPFAMFTFSSISILPAFLIVNFLHQKIGKKGTEAIALFLGGTFTIASSIISYFESLSDSSLLVILVIIGRFGMTIAFISNEKFSSELIPNCAQHQGIVIIQMISFFFTFLSPHILYLQTFYPFLTTFILGTFCFIAFGLNLFLPETQKKTLPETIENGEEFGRNDKFYHFFCFRSQESKSSIKLEDNSKYY